MELSESTQVQDKQGSDSFDCSGQHPYSSSAWFVTAAYIVHANADKNPHDISTVKDYYSGHFLEFK